MTTFVELHILQNFAPSSLNRDDTNSPKDCEFGGYRRARISSQCLKRAMRDTFKSEGLVPAEHLAVRTKRLHETLTERLVGQGRDQEEAALVASTALGGLGLTLVGALTQYLVFLGQGEIDSLLDVCASHWEELLSSAGGADTTASGRAAKVKAKGAIPSEVTSALKRALDGGRAADLALFGRMLADLADKNTDAAAQVAHAISTNTVSMEFDFYTAVDDLKPGDTTGADMLGTVEFNSACFYRYANVDVDQLRKNLGGDDELARGALAAFLRASIDAVPTGKQNSMAAHNPPELVLGVVRKRGLWSLANAFLAPVRPTRDGSLMERSVEALGSYWGALGSMYGTDGIAATRVATMHPNRLAALAEVPRQPVADLVSDLVGAASAGA